MDGRKSILCNYENCVHNDGEGYYVGLTGEENKLKIDTYKPDKKFIHTLICGQHGLGTKINTFKENEFKEELAPINAKIERYEINGENFVKMTYPV